MTSALPVRPRRLVPAVAASMAAFTALALLAACGSGGESDTTLPSCPVSRTGLVDMVPSGPRPCVLYSTSNKTSGGTAADPGPAIPGGAAKTPKGGMKVPKAPEVKRPAAPAPKAPAAPAPKPPSFTKR
ncbi:hypothetical protein [Streptomyces microflavus]|uniref:hypothetical protein n=1 Tax=Streptomyces microflavus TaxID=1919 RepID=UPI0033C17601